MNVLLADDEIPALNDLENAVKEALPDATLHSFSKAREALDYALNTRVDIAFLDINMRVIDGLTLSDKIQQKWHDTNIIFCTGYGEYTSEAMKLHASGYLMKPVSAADIKKELQFLRFPVKDIYYPLTVRIGTDIELFDRNGDSVKFKRNLTKKLFALLFRNGGKGIGVNGICECLWEENSRSYFLEKNRNYLMQLMVDLRKGLEKHGAGNVLKKDETGYYLDMTLIKIKNS